MSDNLDRWDELAVKSHSNTLQKVGFRFASVHLVAR